MPRFVQRVVDVCATLLALVALCLLPFAFILCAIVDRGAPEDRTPHPLDPQTPFER